MKKQIIMDEEEFNGLLIKFANQLKEDWQKEWGYKIVSREGGKKDILVDEPSHLYGALLMTWNKVFDV